MNPVPKIVNHSRNIQLEICCGDVAAVLAAKQGGAGRIELCSGLAEGGLTPSAALIRAAVDSGIEHVNVLIRPRPGDFLYTEEEVRVMEADIRFAVESGVSGLVIGALTPDGDVDTDICRRLIACAGHTASSVGRARPGITFHRAFDVAGDPRESLETIIALGCDCLLTSGMAASAAGGMDLLGELVVRAAGRIQIMAGSGVSPANVRTIVETTGVDAVHSTARCPKPSGMRFRREAVPMGLPGFDEFAPLATSPEIVAELLRILQSYTFKQS